MSLFNIKFVMNKYKKMKNNKSSVSFATFVMLVGVSFWSVSSAQAQNTFTAAIHDMIASAPVGVQILPGLFATAEVVTVGVCDFTGITTDTGLNTPGVFGGGALNIGFDEANRPIGPEVEATRLQSNSASGCGSNNPANGYPNLFGFKINFQDSVGTPFSVPVEYFYGADVDGTELKTSFAFDIAGNFVQSSNELSATSDLTPESPTVAVTTWLNDLGLTAAEQASLAAATPVLSRRTIGANAATPNDGDHQVLYDYSQTLSTVVFLYGTRGNPGNNNSGVSALTLGLPDFEAAKSAPTIGAVMADGKFDATYIVSLENTGVVTLNSLSLVDNVATSLGANFDSLVSGPTIINSVNADPASVTPTDFPIANTSYMGTGSLIDTADAVSLEPGDSFEVTYTVRIDPNGGGGFGNSAEAEVTAEGFDGLTITERDDDGNLDIADNSVTIVPPTPNSELAILKVAGPTPAVNADGTFLQEFTINVANTGNVNISDLTLIDNIEALFTDQYDPSTAAANPVSGVTVAPAAILNTTTGITANTDYDGDTDTSLISVATNAVISPGEEITITFTVLLDATENTGNENLDGSTSNNAVVTGTPPSGEPLAPVSDTADIPADIEPGIGVVKSASVGPLQGNGTFDVTYSILVQNTGNVNLSPLTLADDLVTQLGSAFNGVVTQPLVSGTASTLPTAVVPDYTGTGALISGSDGLLAPSQNYQVTFVVNVDPNAASVPAALANSASAGGTAPGTAGTIMDDSNTGTDPDGVGTGETPNDNPNATSGGAPTIITPPTEVGTIGLLKSASLNDDDGTPGVSAGDSIVYTYVVTNTSTFVDVYNIAVTESGAPAFTGSGTPPVPSSLLDGSDLDAGGTLNDIAAGETITFTASYILTQEDINAGMVDNSAGASGTDPAGNVAEDTSDDDTNGAGSNGAGAGEDDPTSTLLAQTPELGAVKSASVDVLQANGTFDVTYTIEVENTGNVTLAPLNLVDDLSASTQLGAAFNGVTATGAPVVSAVTINVGSVLPATNGTVYLGTTTASSLLDGVTGTLIPGDSYQVVFTVNVDPNAAAAPLALTNTATASGFPPGVDATDPANAVMDDSNTGTDADGIDTSEQTDTNPGGPGEPTPLTPPASEPSLIVAKSLATTPVDLGGGVYQVTYNFVIENDGNVDFTDLQLVDDLNAMVNNPNQNGGSVANAAVTYVSGTVLTPNTTYTGNGSNDMLVGSDVYPVGSTTELSLTFEFTPDVYFGPFNNVAQVSGADPSGAVEVDNSENAVSPTTSPSGDDIESETPFTLTVPSTPITLGWIRTTDNLNGSALIEWQTATEVANAGFNILALNESGEWSQVNATMISSQGDSSAAQNYEFLSEIAGEQFMLVDISVAGVEERHGPFNLNESTGTFSDPKSIEWDGIQEESNRKAEEREQRRREQLQQRLQSSQSRSQNSTVGRFMQMLAASILSVVVPEAHAVDLVSFEVETAGVYQVTHQDLLSEGLDLRGVDLSRIGLKEANDLWPLHKEATGSTFTSNTTLLFPGRGLDSLYSGVNKYTLVLDEGVRDIADDPTSFPGNEIGLAYSYLDEVTYAPQNTYSYLSPEEDDSWFADKLNAINEPAVKTVTLNVDGYLAPLNFGGGFGTPVARQATQNPKLEVSVWGGSALPGNGVTNPDHQVQVALNGESVADISFDGLALNVDETPLVSVDEGDNQVTITVPNENGYLYDLIRLDHVTLKYPRGFDAKDDALVFSSDWSRFKVSNLSSADAKIIRLDEADNAYFMTERGSGSCVTECVYFAGQENSNNSYFVATSSGYSTPGISAAIDASDLSSEEANFMIIAHPDFINTSSQALESYASEITATYESVDIVDVEMIYAAYSGGVVDAYAIKDYINEAYQNRGTRHILLVGGDVYDYQDFSGSGAKSFIPSIYQSISNNVKAVPSDSSYVLIDDDLAPDLTIARLPVRTTADLDNLYAKRQNYLSRTYQDNILIAADEVDNSGYSFKGDAEQLIVDHFASNSVMAVYLDDQTVESAKQQLINSFNQGVSFASYFGHSSTDRWSISSILSGDDIAGLTNSQSPAVVAQWGCWNTFYVSPEHDSMAHRLLLDGSQGAVTVMGASSFTQADAEKRMANYLSANLQQGLSIGDAVLNAKQQIADQTPDQIDVLLSWAVLGFDDMPVFILN